MVATAWLPTERRRTLAARTRGDLLTDLAERLQRTLGSGYTVERELGRGGMATVFLAHDAKHGRRVAIKVLLAELAALGAERFIQEIKIAANLQHPHILGLIDSGLIEGSETGSRPYYVMPYVEGESLRQKLDRETQLPITDAIRIATEIASALDYAHRHGVIHRDIKPENVLLHDGSAIVADFGIALAVSHAGERLTLSGISLGTPAYMSPEQAMGERVITQRSDIYSLGVVTYEMLAGEPPFTGSSAHVIVGRMMAEEPRPLNTIRRHLPPHVPLAVARALEKTPADRFATAHEFSEALTNPAVMLSGAPATMTTAQSPRWARPVTYGVGVLAALLLATAAWSKMHSADSRLVLRYDLTFDSTEAIAPGAAYVTRIAISPDAKRLAYVGGPRAQLLIRARNQLHAIALAGTEGAASPFFSPDGQWVGALTDGAVHLVSLNGGEPITLKSDSTGVAGASWARDGFIYIDGSEIAASLMRVEAKAGAAAHAFTKLDEASREIDHTWPDALPNGKGVVFTVTRSSKSVADVGRTYFIAVAEIPSGKHRIVVNDAMFARYSPSGHLLYVTTDRRLMVVPFDQESMKVTGEPTLLAEGMRQGAFGSTDLLVSATGTLIYGTGGGEGVPEFVWVGRDGKSAPLDTTWRGFFWNPVISPDGTRLATGQNITGGPSIWIKRLDGGAAVRLTLDTTLVGQPAWTADGRAVTFSTYGTATPGLFTKRADGSAPASLIIIGKRGVRSPRWSPDGRWLVFTTYPNQPGASDILGLRPGIDTIAVSLVASKFTEDAPTFSPDGKYLAYISNESGREEVYVVPFPNTSGAKWQVSSSVGTEPMWSHSGKEVFYRNGVGEMIAVSVETTPTFSIRSATTLFPTAQYRADVEVPQYGLSPDDRRFLMIRRSAAPNGERLVVVENWFQELARK